MQLISFTGFKEVGKTTAAETIADEVFHFAEPLYAIAKELGWNLVKDEKGRGFLRDLGKLVRSYNPLYLVDRMESNILISKDYNSPQLFVADGLRFDNEAEMLKRHDAFIVEIVRPGYESDGDITEQGIDRKYIDLTISNDGNVEEFQKKVRELV